MQQTAVFAAEKTQHQWPTHSPNEMTEAARNHARLNFLMDTIQRPTERLCHCAHLLYKTEQNGVRQKPRRKRIVSVGKIHKTAFHSRLTYFTTWQMLTLQADHVETPKKSPELQTTVCWAIVQNKQGSHESSRKKFKDFSRTFKHLCCNYQGLRGVLGQFL